MAGESRNAELDQTVVQRQGQIAEWFLQSEELQQAWARVEAAVLRQWRIAKSVEERERLYLKLEVWQDLQRELRAMMERGSSPEEPLS